jgi:hypothetical protein
LYKLTEGIFNVFKSILILSVSVFSWNSTFLPVVVINNIDLGSVYLLNPSWGSWK